jgi:hypothetical protein
MYMLGPFPEDDDAMLHVVELTGNQIEEMKRRAKASNFVEEKPQKNTSDNEKLLTNIMTIEKNRQRKKLIKTIKKKKTIINVKRKNIPQQKRP